MGRLIVRLTHYMRVPVVGLIVAIATFGFLAVEISELSFVGFTALLGVLGIAIGPMYPTSTIVMQNAVKPHQLGTATGAMNFFRSLGSALIVALFGAIVLAGGGGHSGRADRRGRRRRRGRAGRCDLRRPGKPRVRRGDHVADCGRARRGGGHDRGGRRLCQRFDYRNC